MTWDGHSRPGDGLLEDIRDALELTYASTAWERTVDITTYGRQTGAARRIEIWFYRFEDKIYLSGLPGRRSWFANLRDDSRMIFHLKHGLRHDLNAHAVVISDNDLRRRAFTLFVNDMNQPHNPARIPQPTNVEDWMRGSPLVEVQFEPLS